jgi:FtsP/CotA-like multicopper oxidase with cupredoxin domain
VPSRRCDSTNATLPKFEFEPNKNHRLRVINAATLASFQFEIDSHPFAITEVDGTDVLPSPSNRIKINPAQRYSVIINTNVTTTDTFWLRLRLIDDCFSGGNTPFSNPNIINNMKGIVRYSSSTNTSALPTTEPWGQAIEQECTDMDIPFVPVPAIVAPPPDHRFYLVANFRIGDWRLSRGFFNESSWRPNPRSPTLSR